MSHDVVMPQSVVVQSVTARVWAGLLVALAGMVGALLAMPASWGANYPTTPTPRTPYPLMLPVLIAVIAGAGCVAAYRPAVARVTAVVAVLTGLQVGGIAVVAARDWFNFAGAGGSTYERAYVGAPLAVVMAVAASAAVVVGVLLYRTGHGAHRPRTAHTGGGIVAGAAVAVAVPVLLSGHWHSTSVTALGQFALWWSLPWGIGIVAAGALPDAAARRTAVLTVLASVALAVACVAAPVVYGFGVRLPD